LATPVQAVDSRLREQFERDGYLVLESTGWDASVLDGAVSDLDGLYGSDGRKEAGVAYFWHRIQDAWRISANVRSIALAPGILALLEDLYGRKPLPFQTLNFKQGSEQETHSDTLHFNSMPPGYMCGVWVALEDIDMDNGPLVYYPGSHKLPEITMEDVGPDAGPDDYPDYERFIASMIEDRELEPTYGTIGKGQAFLWSANLLHGGIRQADKSRTRHSQVTHFFFEGCKYYTPMHSRPGHVALRKPTWITEDPIEPPDTGPGYEPEQVRETIAATVPESATVLFVSRGDDALLELAGRREAQHFPQNDDGSYTGYHPADSAEAIAQLEELRVKGAGFLVLPRPALWWLEYYEAFAHHLETRHRLVARASECVIFELAV
jgi:hypothetical protein